MSEITRSFKTRGMQAKSGLGNTGKEFLRYVIVGGAAFIADFSALYLFKEYLFYSLGTAGIIIASSLSFLIGLLINYVLSIYFVFQGTAEFVLRRRVKNFLLFAAIGVCGLLITQAGMLLGVFLLGQQAFLWVKIFVAGFVLLWNFFARKILIFTLQH